MSANPLGNSPKSLNVIGLISGGKDSFFSLLHCLANGHRIVALANLYPPRALALQKIPADLNSYMYQTAGHGLTQLYSDALELPLFRQEITGSAVNPSKVYEYVESKRGDQRVDETEDLMPLLRKILQQHPDANAVCSGAILSTYQRTRIESVVRRLNLVPLSYLWQYPSLPPPSAGGLLDDMAAVGFDVRLVKVASGGLDEDLLWQNLMDRKIKAKVEKAMQRFGGSVLGEGGEYETLVVSGPTGIFKKSILVDDQKMWIGKSEGGEAWLTFSEHAGTTTTNAGDQPLNDQEEERLPRAIGLWDMEFKETVSHMKGKISFIADQANPQNHVMDQAKVGQLSHFQGFWKVKPVIFRTQTMFTICNLTARVTGSTAIDQMSGISSRLLEILLENSRSTSDVVFTTILLRSMVDFAAVNDIYGRLFTKPNPPARVTVACGKSMPNEVSVMVSFVVTLGASTGRDGLHVQSRSYWAPSNIGPYSQAISVRSNLEDSRATVYVAGQIPLVPASMEVLQIEDGNMETASETEAEIELFQKRASLALQHLWRIGKVMSVGWWMGGVAFITGKSELRMKATIAWEIWKAVHQKQLWVRDVAEDDDLDVWDMKYGGLESLKKGDAEIPSLPDIARLSGSSSGIPPDFLAIQVEELPRGCDIEWQSLGSTDPYAKVTSYVTIPLNLSDKELRVTLTTILENHVPPQLQQATVYTNRAELISDLGVQVVPCGAIYGPECEEVAAGVVLQYA